MQVNQTNFLKTFFNFTLAKYEMLCYYISTVEKTPPCIYDFSNHL